MQEEQKEEVKHTILPWEVDPDNPTLIRTAYDIDARGARQYICDCDSDAWREGEVSQEEAIANAAFTVECCNKVLKEQKEVEKKDLEKILSYILGLRQGVERFAWWKDGQQFVGSCGYTLKQAYVDIDIVEKSMLAEVQRAENEKSI